ncbi:TetR/AcrR family transcriptional regulator [Kitasatospora setae]|uniref:Putative TetR family transcriptional regulator n=2 Tax=Kitasatospora TaxID=2063 RepID=E4NCU3_KITSK|nr:putative TetR family transcriptional regulator [Kitasatospora setae KM-6054]
MRMSAEERRESVVRAAMVEFARSGYRGTSTEAIARRVGVSQPYLFRLYPNKQAIFEAAAEHCMEETWRVFDRASEGLSGEAACEAMGEAYLSLVEDREQVMMQMQIYVSVFAAESAGDGGVGEMARAGWSRLFERIEGRIGDRAKAAEFMAHGMLINTLVALGYPFEDRLWTAFLELNGKIAEREEQQQAGAGEG